MAVRAAISANSWLHHRKIDFRAAVVAYPRRIASACSGNMTGRSSSALEILPNRQFQRLRYRTVGYKYPSPTSLLSNETSRFPSPNHHLHSFFSTEQKALAPFVDSAQPLTMTTNGSTPTKQPQPSAQMTLEVDSNGQSRFRGCSNIKHYEFLSKLGEGTFGEVYKARSRRTGNVVALKKILLHNEKDGLPITAIREIRLLKMLSHSNVLTLEEMAIERGKGEGRKKAIMYMVTPYMDHDLSGLLENPDVHFTTPQIKCYMMQLLKGLKYLHDNQILHRDMKAANLLINNRGNLQIADFGLARQFEESPPTPGNGNGVATRDYTGLVVTRWYRPPELLLQLRRYTPAIDMWGVGCVFGEMFLRKPILAGNSDLNQIQMIFDLVGTPTAESMPGWRSLPGCEGVKEFNPRPSTLVRRFREQGPIMISLIAELLKLDWQKRINAVDALGHPYFFTEPLPATPESLPRFGDSHDLDRRRFRSQKAALPPAPAGGTVGMQSNDGYVTAPRRAVPPSGPPNGYRRDHHPPKHNHQSGPNGHGSRHNREHRDPSRVPPRPNNDRQPAWMKERHHPSLPPRPVNVAWGPHGGGQRGPIPPPPPPPPPLPPQFPPPPLPPPRSHPPPPLREHLSKRMDSYVPDYADGTRHRGGAGAGGAPGADRHDRGRAYDRKTRSRSRSPRPVDRARDRDRDDTRMRDPDWELYRR